MRAWLANGPVRATVAAGMLLLMACAHIVTPTGGPKDETPPKVLAESPPNLSTGFAATGFAVTFDEFVQLQNPADLVLISPPMAKKPTYTMKRKTMHVKFNAPLNPATTYIINFGEAIRDFNEGNILQNYSYVLSTGSAVDSMELGGRLTDALTGGPMEGAMVMLYVNNADSLPRDTLPDFFGMSDKEGRFLIKHIPDLPYKVFALKDANTNFRFDVPDEPIGFLDTMVRPNPPLPKPAVDTLANDTATAALGSAALAPDTLRATIGGDSSDATAPRRGKGGMLDSLPPRPFLDIVMFVEEDTAQFLKKASTPHYGKLVFAYNRPVSRFTALLPMGSVPRGTQWALKDFSALRDTVTLWVLRHRGDTLPLIVRADALTDTVELVMKSLEASLKKDKRPGGKRAVQAEKFELRASTQPPAGKPLMGGKPLILQWNHPIADIDLPRMELREDSVLVQFSLTTRDTALRRFELAYPWRADAKYSLLVPDSTVTDIFGLRNDTLRAEWRGAGPDAFGELELAVTEAAGHQFIITLIDGAKREAARAVVTSDTTVTFSGLDPGRYSLTVTDDINGNGRWDSGRYSERLQPEPFFTLRSEVEIRANWLLGLQWDASGRTAE